MNESDIRNKYIGKVPGVEFAFPEENFIKFHGYDGAKLYTYRYSTTSPKALIVVLHGTHAYSNNQAIYAKYFSDINCEVVAFDYRGHGKSEGTPGLIPNFHTLLEDATKFVTEMSQLYPSLPIFLLGGSLGGCLCIHLSFKLGGLVKGMILTSPAISPNMKCQCFLRCVLSVFNFFSPSMRLVRGDLRSMTKNEDLINYMEENPFIYTGRARVGTINTVARGMRAVMGLIDRVQTPFVIVHGTDDSIVEFRMSEYFYKVAPVQDKNLWAYSGLNHGLSFEKEIYEICERLCGWINERV